MVDRHATLDFATVDALTIAYESSGTGEPAVVFVHGAFQDRSYFARQIAHLSGRRRVVALDLRGHGDSTRTPAASLDDLAADVIAVADDAGVEVAVLCGHSMAGVVALKVAQARPDLVRGIAMVDGIVLFPEQVRMQARKNLLPALESDQWLPALEGYFTAAILDPNDSPELRQRVLSDVRRTEPGFARALFGDLFSSDHADDLVAVECPLLYLHAKAPADLERLKELRRDAMVDRIVGSGHYAMLSAPDQINAALDRFLAVIDAATPFGEPAPRPRRP